VGCSIRDTVLSFFGRVTSIRSRREMGLALRATTALVV
jgi:hypothetical protein